MALAEREEEGLVGRERGPGFCASGPSRPWEIAPRVWVFRSEGFAEQLATLIALGEEALVVDPPMFREEAVRIGEFAQAQGLEVKWLALTHAHGDHSYGMAFFPNAIAIAQREFWSTWRRLAPLEAEYFTRVLPRYQIPALREPDISFKEELRLKRAGREVVFRHAPGHSPDGMWVELPAERLWIMGDTALPIPYLASGDREELRCTLARLLNGWRGGTLVLGHHQVATGEEARRVFEVNLRYLELLPRKVASAIKEGKSKREVLALSLSEFGISAAGWEKLAQELHRVNLELTWEEFFARQPGSGAGIRSSASEGG